MNLDRCLPVDLRGPATTIARVGAGLSGAGVYRVDATGQSFILKVASESQPLGEWQRKLHIQRLAAEAGLAPRIVHVDEERRAIVSVFVVDRSFPAFWANPATRDAALALLGGMLRRVHELPLPAGVEAKDGKSFLATIWSGLAGTFAIPSFVVDAVERVLAEEPPAAEHPTVLSHNDLNPTNLVYDGERLLLLDWDTAGPNEPYYDLAAISVFLRMDDATCQRLLAAHEGAPVNVLPARFVYDRRLVAALCGAMFLHLARTGGYAGANGTETLDTTASLGEFYQRMRSGGVNIASPDGQWAFGLALVKQSLALSA